MDELPLADELSLVSARMSGLLLSQETVGTALDMVTSLAKDTIPGSLGAGVTLTDERGQKITAGASNPRVERADAVQYELEEGPCLTAWARRELVRIDDMAAEKRWPRWCPVAHELGMRAAMSAPLVAGHQTLGAMKVYAERPAAYDEGSEDLLARFGAQAAILVANVQALEKAERLSEGLKEALRSRDLIGAAKGILMARSEVDEETAFAMLVSASQRENRKLREVAEALVQSTARRRR